MKKQAMMLTILMLAIIVLMACGPQEVEQPPDQVSVRLKWLHQSQFAGLYVADQMGFYKDENIEVTLNPGGLEIDEIETVVSGQDDFAIVDGTHALIRRAEGSPVVVCAVTYRLYPVVYFSLRESGIQNPYDFVGKRVIVNPVDFVLPAMMDKLDLDISQVEAVPPDYDLESFFAGEVDVWSGYLTNQVVTARAEGYELNIIYPDHYGVHLYGDVIIANERLIEENPDLVERFLRATLRGWRYAIENPDEAVMMTLKYDESLIEAHEQAGMKAQIPLIHTGEGQIGWMQDRIWQEMHQILLVHGSLDKPIDVNQVYTMKFLHRIYGEEED